MTQIKLRTSDQHLIAAQKAKIAAGDINSVILHVEFDSAWSEFPVRKALFSNDSVDGGRTQDILLVGGECIVPHEQLSSSGVLSISVTGYTSDGNTKKTSAIVKLKVHASLSDAITTVEPTMDLFMQYLAALTEKMNPVTENINGQLAANLKAVNEAIEEQKAWMKGTVLWENPDPSTEIDDDGLTIPIDRTQYPRLHIEMLDDTIEPGDDYTYFLQCICVHSNGKYFSSSATGASYRTITVTDTAINFGKCSHLDSSTIPFKIIGYKY